MTLFLHTYIHYTMTAAVSMPYFIKYLTPIFKTCLTSNMDKHANRTEVHLQKNMVVAQLYLLYHNDPSTALDTLNSHSMHTQRYQSQNISYEIETFSSPFPRQFLSQSSAKFKQRSHKGTNHINYEEYTKATTGPSVIHLIGLEVMYTM